MPTGLSHGQKKFLKGYGKWRPRIGRGAQFATIAGFLSGMSGNRKLILPAVIGAGLTGVGDRMLEEASNRSKAVRKLVGSGFKTAGCTMDTKTTTQGREPWSLLTEGAEMASIRDRQGVLGQLFSHRSRMEALAGKQLHGLFPGSGGDESLSRSVTAAGSASDASRVLHRSFRR